MKPIKDPLKILFVIPGYEPAWAFGGTTTGLSALARGFVANGHKISVYTTNADGRGRTLDVPIATPVDLGGVQVYYYPPTFGPRTVFDSRQLLTALRQTVQNYDIVYLAALYQWIGIETPFVCARQKIPVVFNIAGSLSRLLLRRKSVKKKIWYNLFLKSALKQCSALHLTTQYEREQTEELLSWSRNYLVPNCINVHRFRPRPDLRQEYRQRYGLDEEIPVFLAVGRIDPKKRIDYLIQALAALKNDEREFHLLIAGDDTVELAQEFKKLSQQKGVSEQITWTGMIANEEIVGLYAASDLFVHLSEDENFAIVVAEAMATGLPILVTPGVGVWHAVKDAAVGRCVELDVEATAEGLRDFLDHREQWANFGREAVEIARNRFEAKNVARLMAHAFQDVIAESYSSECSWHIPN